MKQQRIMPYALRGGEVKAERNLSLHADAYKIRQLEHLKVIVDAMII